MRRSVVVTGAAGSIGQVVVHGLTGRWDVRATDRQDAVERLDVTDLAACTAAFAGVDAVVHLAADPDPEASFTHLLGPNVVGAWTVASAAMAARVRRLVLASSLQAVSAYPDGHQVQEHDAPRPANVYGATKAWAEALGAWVAASSTTSVVALRIGLFAPSPPVGPAVTPRDLSAWLSPRDAVELVRAAVEAEVTGMVVANGVSARSRHADLRAAHRLGYVPVDDAWSDDDRGASPASPSVT